MNLQQLIERYIAYRQSLGERVQGQRVHPSRVWPRRRFARRRRRCPARASECLPGRARADHPLLVRQVRCPARLLPLRRQSRIRRDVALAHPAAETATALRPLHLLARGVAPPVRDRRRLPSAVASWKLSPSAPWCCCSTVLVCVSARRSTSTEPTWTPTTPCSPFARPSSARPGWSPSGHNWGRAGSVCRARPEARGAGRPPSSPRRRVPG